MTKEMTSIKKAFLVTFLVGFLLLLSAQKVPAHSSPVPSDSPSNSSALTTPSPSNNSTLSSASSSGITAGTTPTTPNSSEGTAPNMANASTPSMPSSTTPAPSLSATSTQLTLLNSSPSPASTAATSESSSSASSPMPSPSTSSNPNGQNATTIQGGLAMDAPPQSNSTWNGTGSSMRMHPAVEGVPLFERPVSGEDVSGNSDEEKDNHDAISAETRGQWNGTYGHGELALLPAQLDIPGPIQRHHHAEVNGTASTQVPKKSITVSSAENTTISSSTTAPTVVGNGNSKKSNEKRKKRDLMSDTMDRLKVSMVNGQPQTLDGPNANDLPQQTQIIQIPPIDLSGQNQNIILVSDTGNVTLRRGNGYLSVQTVMTQQQQH